MSAAAGSAIYARLATDTALSALTGGTARIYYAVAPAKAPAPYVVIQMTDGDDSRVFGARATARERWTISGWCEGHSHLPARQIIERVDALLDEYDLVVGGGTAMAMRRIAQLPDMTEEDNGVVYRQAAARYELEVRA